MQIIIDPHTLIRANERGASEEEIKDVLLNGTPSIAKKNRSSKWKVFSFKAERNEKFYEQKRIEVIFIQEFGNIITVTVYVYYGKWNEL